MIKVLFVDNLITKTYLADVSINRCSNPPQGEDIVIGSLHTSLETFSYSFRYVYMPQCVTCYVFISLISQYRSDPCGSDHLPPPTLSFPPQAATWVIAAVIPRAKDVAFDGKYISQRNNFIDARNFDACESVTSARAGVKWRVEWTVASLH